MLNRTSFLSFVFLLVTPLAVVYSDDCPELYRRYSRIHSYCLPPSSTCKLLKSGVSAEERDVILKTHNELRSKLARGKQKRLPKGSNMLQMEWDEELARIAQKHANQCIYKHDCKPCKLTVNYPGVGQNMAVKHTTVSGPLDANWKHIVERWYNEVKHFNPSAVNAFTKVGSTGKIGHFTQVAWANSWKVGCGYSSYSNDPTDKYATSGLYACNYGPSGNWDGEPIYIAGKPCTKCPENSCCGSGCSKTPSYEGLCQITGSGGPKYPRDPRYTYYCNFEEGNPDCARKVTSGVDGWKVTNTLSGSFIGIVLSGGQKSTLSFTKPMDITTDQSCLSVTYRMGPNVDGDMSSGTAQATFVDSNGNANSLDLSPTSQLMPYGMGMTWASKFQLSLTFEVPVGSPKQYFEVTEISARPGTC